MNIDIRLYIARILCLFMAIYLFNFSIDTCTAKNKAATAGSDTYISETEEVENLLGMVLDISMAVEVDGEYPEKTENENEVESVDVLEFFHGASSLSFFRIQLLQRQLLHLPNPDLKTLYPEVICPPPKALFYSAVA
jgi:hypothetical protein